MYINRFELIALRDSYACSTPRGLTRDTLQLLSQPALPLHVVGYLTGDMLGAGNLDVEVP